MLTVTHLQKSFGGVVVVDDLDLTVERGEVVALVGANGAGKTTTLRTIVGLESADSGEVLFDGEAFDERRADVRRRVCSLLDDHAWFPEMTVAEHLALYALAFGEDASVVVEALDSLEIAHVGDRMPGTLSSGQTQRFRLAQALVRPWDLLLLDEPEQRLDVEGRAWLGRYLRGCADGGAAVLMASHDPTLLDAAGARRVDVDRVDVDRSDVGREGMGRAEGERGGVSGADGRGVDEGGDEERAAGERHAGRSEADPFGAGSADVAPVDVASADGSGR